MPIRITSDTTIDCDVVILGSGAGGGTAAGVPSEAGLDVLEAGRYALHVGKDPQSAGLLAQCDPLSG